MTWEILNNIEHGSDIIFTLFCVTFLQANDLVHLHFWAPSWKGFKGCFSFRGKHSVTWHEERRESKSGWDQVHRWNIYHWRSALLSWNASLSPLSAFLTWHRGTWFPLCCPIYAISEGEVITQGWGGMFFILSSLPARLLEIRLLFGQLKDGACWGTAVWHRPKRGMPQREQWGFDPYLFTISVIKPWASTENISQHCLSTQLKNTSPKYNRISPKKQSSNPLIFPYCKSHNCTHSLVTS